MEAQDDDQVRRVCYECIGDQFLAAEVKGQATSGRCFHCGALQETIALRDLAHRVHEALHEHFRLTLEYPDEPYEYLMDREGLWERRGDPVELVIGQLAWIEPEIATPIVELLSSQYSYRAVKEGEEDPYGAEAMYEAKSPDASSFRYTWRQFKQHIGSRSRFFSEIVEEMLGFIFGNLHAHIANDDTPVVREFKPGDETLAIWRGRRTQSTGDVKRIFMNLTQEMGPPPSRFAKAGRMNAEGIPVFYGATDRNTCVSEVRAAVGGQVVLGRFELLRPISLLDLDALASVYAQGSCFDPDYAEQEARAEFFRQLVAEISQPVMPQDESQEYIPTQVVAEYFAHRVEPRIDGIIFRSSQTGGDGRNLVLLNHACVVEPYFVPEGTDIEVYVHPYENGEYGSVFVSETVPSPIPSEATQSESRQEGRPGPIRLFEDVEASDAEQHESPTLRLDLESIEVLNINGVSYESDPRTVARHRRTQEERDAFLQHFTDF